METNEIKNTRFIILCPARTGSTMLRMAINSHPSVTCHGELLGPNRILGFEKARMSKTVLTDNEAMDLRSANSFEFIYNNAFTINSSAVGFKLLYSQVGDIQFAELMEKLVTDTEIRIVHLWRRNLLDRYLSFRLLLASIKATGGKDVENKSVLAKRREVNKPAAVSVPPEFVAQDCRNQIAARNRMLSYFSGHPIYEMVYEDLIASPASYLDALCDFLSVERKPLHLPAKREQTISKKEYFSNYQELINNEELKKYQLIN